MPYIVKGWIPVDEEDPEIYTDLGDAQSGYNHCRDMQPENHYQVVEVDQNGEEV